MKKIVLSKKAPLPVGPYSQAVKAGGFMFCAGQIPINPQTGKIDTEDVVAQTEQVMANIQAVLSEEGLTLEHVVKTTVFLKDLHDFSKMNEVYAKYFSPATAPARSTVQVAKLPLDARVEIEVTAHL